MSDAIAIISRPIFEKLAGKAPACGVELLDLRRYDSTAKGLDTLAEPESKLFLVTVRPDGALWLVQLLVACKKDAKGWSGIRDGAVIDLGPVRHLLRIAKDVPAAKLAMSLQTPRALGKHDSTLLYFIATEGLNKARSGKPYVAKLPKWLLEDAAKAADVADAKAMDKPKGKATEKPKAKAPEKPKGKATAAEKAKATAVLGSLINAAISVIEEASPDRDEAVSLLREPKRQYGLRGELTESVQTVLGGMDTKELVKTLGAELAPFVDGPSLAVALRYVKNGDVGDIVQEFAVRAVDDLARALLALALGRPEAMPPTCVGYKDVLARSVGKAKALLPD